jgi:LmbE family N-acetylglucosaminyl deacetylase
MIMNEPLKLMCILAHPDDESLGTGGILARYAAEGVQTSLITATRGQHGWPGNPLENPGPFALGQLREAELMAAARSLGLHETILLDYMDGELDQAQPDTVISDLVAELRRVRPQVVVTFDPYGAYGHPDHIAISQLTTAAVAVAANTSDVDPAQQPAHQVSKLYYLATNAEQMAVYEAAFGELTMPVDGVMRRAVSWPDWAITTRINTAEYWQQVSRAIDCHRSQLPGYDQLRSYQRRLWQEQSFYRVFSLVSGGRTIETDLFAGLRHPIVQPASNDIGQGPTIPKKALPG